MRFARTILAVALVLTIAAPLLAQNRPRRGGGRQAMRPFAMELRMLEGLDLTSEQKAKVEALVKEYSPKMEEAMKARQGIFTEEQRKALPEAMKAAREAGKRGPEAMAAIQAELKVTDEQKAKLAEAEKQTMTVRKEFLDKARELLTPEQLEQLKKKSAEGRRPRGNR